MSNINSISPIDGRYAEKVQDLQNYFSESALMKYRVIVEVRWLIFLFNVLKIDHTKPILGKEEEILRNTYEKFSEKDAKRIKEIESTINHDVKAIEYFIKEKIKGTKLEEHSEFIHFACTSEDINNNAYALLIKDSVNKIMIPALNLLIKDLKEKAKKYQSIPMLGRTHGQSATPTTVGKEFIVYVSRLEKQLGNLNNASFYGKMNGATGNYNAHFVAYPDINWIKASERFIDDLGLTPNLYTTQIESHDFLSELFDIFTRINSILTDLSRDMWFYISYEIFKQKVIAGEVGSSTMPHKVNPIDFENAEGNFGIANALFQHMSTKLLTSRMQRDLTDSTVFRNIGTAFANTLIAYKSLLKGLSKIELNREKLNKDLEENYEVLAEALQTVMRTYKISGAYEKLKSLTRGKKLTQKEYQSFVEKLELPDSVKKRLSGLTPQKYIGLAEKLVEKYK